MVNEVCTVGDLWKIERAGRRSSFVSSDVFTSRADRAGPAVNFPGQPGDRSSATEMEVCRFHLAITRNERSQTAEHTTRPSTHVRCVSLRIASSRGISETFFSFPLPREVRANVVEIVAQ